MWKAGDKAYCIERFLGEGEMTGDPTLNIKPNGVPQKGVIYLVDGFLNIGSGALMIAGLPIYNKNTKRYTGWVAYKFRKIVLKSERKEQYAETRK